MYLSPAFLYDTQPSSMKAPKVTMASKQLQNNSITQHFQRWWQELMNDFWRGRGGVEKTAHRATVPSLRMTGGGGRHSCVQGFGKSPWIPSTACQPAISRIKTEMWHSFSHVHRHGCDAYNTNLFKKRNYTHSRFCRLLSEWTLEVKWLIDNPEIFFPLMKTGNGWCECLKFQCFTFRHMVGIQYLFTAGVSTFSVSPFVSTFSLIPAPDSLLHQSPHLLVCTRHSQFASYGLATPMGLRTFQEDCEVNLLNSKKLPAFPVCTVELSTGYVICEIMTHWMKNRCENPEVFYLS